MTAIGRARNWACRAPRCHCDLQFCAVAAGQRSATDPDESVSRRNRPAAPAPGLFAQRRVRRPAGRERSRSDGDPSTTEKFCRTTGRIGRFPARFGRHGRVDAARGNFRASQKTVNALLKSRWTISRRARATRWRFARVDGGSEPGAGIFASPEKRVLPRESTSEPRATLRNEFEIAPRRRSGCPRQCLAPRRNAIGRAWWS